MQSCFTYDSFRLIRSPISITPFFFMTHYFVSSYFCCILVLWYTFLIHLFSCVITSCHMITIFYFISHFVWYCLPFFYKSNLRMSIGYLEPLVYSYFLQIAYWGAQQLQLKSPKARASFSRDYEELFEMRCATLADCRLADLQTCRPADLQTWRVSTPVVLIQNHF